MCRPWRQLAVNLVRLTGSTGHTGKTSVKRHWCSRNLESMFIASVANHLMCVDLDARAQGAT